MVDMKLLRENPEAYVRAAIDKRIEVDIPRLLEVDTRLREARTRLQEIATEKNRIGKEVPRLSGAQKDEAIARLAGLKQQEAELQERADVLQPEFDALLLQVPQPADPDVPVGRDDTENVELRREGEVRQFSFTPKDHVELGRALDIIDIERGVKLAGTRNYFLKGDGAMLHWPSCGLPLTSWCSAGTCPCPSRC
jgi:seryl-tRNA synthetase